MYNVFILSSSKLIKTIIKRALIPHGYNIADTNIETFRMESIGSHYRFIIVDFSIKKELCIKIVKNIRKNFPTKAIIGITTKRDLDTIKELYSLDIDELLRYPFHMEELLMRLRALKNHFGTKRGKTVVNLGPITLDTVERTVAINDRYVTLRNKEFNLLEYLIKNAGRSVTRSELLDNVWDYRKIISSNTVDVHIKNLREKLPDGIIKTVYGRGYLISKSLEINDTDNEKYFA
jgi:DNA-binding response OmpR family regulator